MAIFKLDFAPGHTLYANIRNLAGQVWNGTAFENYNSSNWSTYVVAMAEDGACGFYKGTMPAVGEDRVSIHIYRRKGGSAAESDAPAIGALDYIWDGTTPDSGLKSLLLAYRLDELIAATAGAVPPTIGSLLDQVMNKNSSQTFVQATDSLEAIKDADGGGATADDIANAVRDKVLTGTLVADSFGERLRAIDDKLPSGNLSGFDPSADGVNLNASQAGVTIGTVNALGTTAKAHVKAEVVAALGTDTVAEMASGLPPSAPTMRQALMYIYMAWRNKQTHGADEIAIFNAAGSKIAKATVSDNGITFTKDSYGAP